MTALLHASLTQRSQAVSLGMEHSWVIEQSKYP